MKVKMSAQGGSASGGKEYLNKLAPLNHLGFQNNIMFDKKLKNYRKTKLEAYLTGVIFYVVFLSGFLIWGNAQAACTGSSPTWTAADCSNTEVAACITAASSGDTINIPAGECTWTSGITIPDAKKITLNGAGAQSTVISHGNITAISMGTSGSRITEMGFIQTTGLCIEVKGTGWRIDHNQFTNTSGTSQYTIIANGTDIEVTAAGLIDNNDFVQGRIDVEGMGTFAKNSANWVKPSVLGTQDAVYIEDNIFYKTVSSGGNVIDSNRANSYVARYNYVNGTTIFEFHSLQSDNERSGRNWEIYGNAFNASSYTYRMLSIRGGTGVIFGNTYSGANTDYTLTFDNVRSYTSLPIMGLCDGSSYVDGNLDSTGWPCRDQIGRGADVSLWDPVTENPSPTQASQPAYVWLNRKGAAIAGAAVVNNCGDHIKADRDYYVEGASFNGTSGVGCGTLASRPDTCTTGVGYWATDQSCTDLTGMVGVDPETPISGTLYKCTATDTWTSYYTPYTYPHPLREASDIVAPASPTGLSVN